MQHLVADRVVIKSKELLDSANFSPLAAAEANGLVIKVGDLQERLAVCGRQRLNQHLLQVHRVQANAQEAMFANLLVCHDVNDGLEKHGKFVHAFEPVFHHRFGHVQTFEMCMQDDSSLDVLLGKSLKFVECTRQVWELAQQVRQLSSVTCTRLERVKLLGETNGLDKPFDAGTFCDVVGEALDSLDEDFVLDILHRLVPPRRHHHGKHDDQQQDVHAEHQARVLLVNNPLWQCNAKRSSLRAVGVAVLFPVFTRRIVSQSFVSFGDAHEHGRCFFTKVAIWMQLLTEVAVLFLDFLRGCRRIQAEHFKRVPNGLVLKRCHSIRHDKKQHPSSNVNNGAPRNKLFLFARLHEVALVAAWLAHAQKLFHLVFFRVALFGETRDGGGDQVQHNAGHEKVNRRVARGVIFKFTPHGRSAPFRSCSAAAWPGGNG
eukprot:m.18534 g.18534  ORF g.18534 m.18534 type:complete len:431 (-) comp5743_c0_seq1:28-1320(-)